MGLSYGDIISDALLYAAKIVASFYKVQDKHIKGGVVGSVYVFVSNSKIGKIV